MADIKPQMGQIPEPEPLQNVSVGKNYFKVELLVGKHNSNRNDDDDDDHDGISTSGYQLMKPFHQSSTTGEPLSIDYYVATPGLSFIIRCKLARPIKAGALYGARVYIDSAKLKETRQVFKKWGHPGDQNGDDDETDVDLSVADHYFWMTPGQQEHTIHGFYRSPDESQRFVFAEPPRKKTVDGDNSVLQADDELNKIGTIRVVFCCVDSNSSGKVRNLNHCCKPKQVTIDEKLDQKIKMSTKPGIIIKDGCSLTTSDIVPNLKNEIVYERRLIYNTYEGFSARRTTHQYSIRGGFYKGMPLKCFRQPYQIVRFQGIKTFLQEVRDRRIDLTTEQRIDGTQAAGRNPPPQAPQVLTNDWVCVEDLVHHISKSLSPAASYILSTGVQHQNADNGVKNYGEKYVQKQGASKDEQFQNFAEKENGLVQFFQKHPGVYDLELFRKNQNKYKNKNSYRVKLSVIELLDSSDEE